MVIYIDKSIASHFSQEVDREELEFFCNVAHIYKEGKCILCGSLESLIKLAQTTRNPHQQIYMNAISRHYENGTVLRIAEIVFVISCTSTPDLPHIIRDKCKILTIDNAMKIDFSSGCSLLGENIEDCKFYHMLGDYFCHKNAMHNSISIKTEYLSGGGDTTSSVLCSKVSNDKKPVLCIADSDRKWGASQKYPCSFSEGSTIRSIEAISTSLSKQGNSIPFKVLKLPVHEVENLIPTDILKSLSKEFPAMKQGIRVLEKLKFVRDGEPLLYYDYKKGLESYDCEPKEEYWSEIYSIGGFDDEKIVGESPGKWPGILKTKLLERANAKMNINPENFNIDTHLTEIWDQIGKTIFTWCGGFDQIRL